TRLPKRQTVTVCVAAISDSSTIIGASDRMITAGDVEFEPPQAKIYPLTSSIAAMIAGDASLQIELLYAVNEKVRLAIEANPRTWLSVKEVADWYYEQYQ